MFKYLAAKICKYKELAQNTFLIFLKSLSQIFIVFWQILFCFFQLELNRMGRSWHRS